MIENFTAEELETIKKELGFYDKRVKLDNGVKHRQRIEKMLAGKPFAGHVLTSDKGVIWCIGFLASCVFNNFSKRYYKKTKAEGGFAVCQTIDAGLEGAYDAFYAEVLDVMEKYNMRMD